MTKNNCNVNLLIKKLISITLDSTQHNSSVIVTNSRHFQALRKSQKALLKVKKGINESIEIDLLAMDIRTALDYLGEITGEITTDDLLDNMLILSESPKELLQYQQHISNLHNIFNASYLLAVEYVIQNNNRDNKYLFTVASKVYI